MAQNRGRGRGRIGAASLGRGRGRGRGGGVGQFLAPHTGRQAGRIANSEAGTEFNPGIRQERQEAKGSRKRQADLGSWYAQLAADYGQGQAAGAAALQSVQDTTSKQLGEAGERSSADQARLAHEDESFANLVGGPKDTQGLSRIAEAGAAAARSRVALNQPVAAEQANFVARLGSDKAASRMKGIEARTEERSRRDKILSEIRATRKEKGQARVANKEKIRESDRGYAAEVAKLKLARREARSSEQAAAASAALAQVESARQAREGAISNRQAQERIGIERTNAATSRRSQQATARNYRNSNKGGLTPSERLGIKQGHQNAVATAKSLIRQRGKPIRSDTEWAELEEAVRTESEVSAAEARAAVARLRKQAGRAGYKRRKQSIARNYPHR
jgi:hypothetical protein